MTKAEIKNYIQTAAAAEFEDDKIVYYIHISDDGSLLKGCEDADETITCELSPEDYGMTEEEYRTAENPEAIYSHEIDGDPIYERIVDILFEKANKYIGSMKKEEK